MSRFVRNSEEFDRAVAADRLLRVVEDCPDPHWNGMTILECLDCGVSNPYDPEYPTETRHSVIPDFSDEEIKSLEESVGWDANGSPVE